MCEVVSVNLNVETPEIWRSQEHGLSEENLKERVEQTPESIHRSYSHAQYYRHGATEALCSSHLTTDCLRCCTENYSICLHCWILDCLWSYSFYPLFVPFGMVMLILCHCILEVFKLSFHLYRGLQISICLKSQRRLGI